MKVAAREIERDGEKFIMLDKIRPKMKLADGHIRLISDDPTLQATGTKLIPLLEICNSCNN